MKNIIQKVAQYINKILITTINNQKGVVLPIILMAIGGLSLIGAAAVSVSSGEMNIAHNDRNYKIALNMAEAGIQDAADAISGNRYVLPAPLGSVQSASYSFSTALDPTGRYIVTISLPVLTSVDPAAQGDTQITVGNTQGLAAGDSIIIGNNQVQMTSKIGTINGNILTLVDDKNKPAPLKNAITNGMFVALNKIRVTSTGQSGMGLGGAYTLASWRNVATLPTTIPTPTGGTIRSAVTLQAEYNIQELEIFDSFQANVWTSGNKFNGPMLVTNDLEVSPYSKGDFSGPIFQTTNATIAFYAASGTPHTTPKMVYPDIPKIITIPAANVNVADIVKNAASNAACYQTACGDPKATQQIYYVNGYQIDVYDSVGLTKAPSASTSSDITITSLSTQYVENLPTTITVNFHAGATIPATFNLFFNGTNNPNKLTPTVVGNPPGVSIGGAQANDINLTAAAKNSDFSVTVSIPNNVATGGTYYILARPSGGANYYNYLYLTVGPLKLTSQVKQGNVTLGNHTGHTTIQKTILDARSVNGKYVYGNNNTVATTNSWITPADANAVLFDGQITNTMNTGNTKLTPGQRCEYNTTYFIHTNAVGSCADQDIAITSHTIVTFVGTRKNPCNISEQLLLFEFETIWNHKDTAGYGPLANGLINTLNSGVQPNDADPGVQGIPHKGYYKWIKTVKVVEDENKPMKPTPLLGDREFNSVFNHSSFPEFTGAIVNWNIKEIRMVGWSNPPTVFYAPNGTPNGQAPVANSTMKVSPVPFPTSNWTDALASIQNLDNDDINREYSGFATTPMPNGFDFIGIDVTTFDYNGNRYLLDSSTLTPPTNKVALYSTPIANTDPTVAGIWKPSSTLSISGSSPFLPTQAQAPLTTITATNSGPLTELSIKRGISNLFFDPANGIAFNMKEVKVETKSTGYSQIIIGSTANPALVYAGEFKVETDSCTQSTIDFTFVGKLIAKEVELENNVTFDIKTNLTTGGACLNPKSGSYIYLKKSSWQEIRN